MVQEVPGPNFVGTPNDCVYDAAGRRAAPCNGEAGGWLGFDGHNVVREKLSSVVRWRFAQGPGLDDPLVGLYWNSTSGAYERYYYVTDGNGRLLSFANQSGAGQLTTPTYTTNGGNQAGAISASTSFANARSNSASVPSLSFYRNRYYDQYSGRWTQEDPIGPAGGVNLYQYAGNNPAAFTDPFGLCENSKTSKSDCRTVTPQEGVKIAAAAASTPEWTYTQGFAGTPKKCPTKNVGDCTDFVQQSMIRPGVNVGYVTTPAFPTSSDYVQVSASQARPGDVFVRSGHAGIVEAVGSLNNGSSVVVVWQNGGSPGGPGSVYRDGSTGQWLVGPSTGTYYRALVPVR